MTELPTTFGKYYLTEKLATGGMAEIYLAKLIGPGGFEKSLVIKQIHPRLSGQRHFVDLFVAEAKTLVALTHGNIVPVYELGVVDETYFIAMEYIDGPTLYRLTETMARREALMDPNVAAWITARILEGLDYAHRKGEGVIHRDLSPRNVMMSRDGDVKLVDFGIAVTLGEGDSDSQSAPTGSFPYMSPEQVRREPLSGQTDLFSAGVLCWEMLAGRRLFARMQPEATLAAVLEEDIPRPSSLRPEVPAKLDEVVMRALERDQGARWSSAGDMLAALNRYIYSLDETPGPRDVAALVAKFCPPETRRLPTHLEAIAHEAAAEDSAPVEAAGAEAAPTGGPSTSVIERGAGPSTSVIERDGAPAGPSTAVIPRDGSQPKGKRPQRHQTFATHVELEGMLSRATPLFPIDAIKDKPADEDDVISSAARDSKRMRARSEKPGYAEETAADRRGMVAPPLPVPGRNPPSRAFLVLMALGGLGLGAASLYVFYEGRSQVMRPDAPLREAAVPDATQLDAGAPDAPAPPVDGPPPTVDALVPVVHADAAVRTAIDASLARPDAPGIDAAAALATLRIGADPWGQITIDGKPSGNTPKEMPIPAGHHTVEITYPGVTPPRKQTFAVDVGPGETKTVQADFH